MKTEGQNLKNTILALLEEACGVTAVYLGSIASVIHVGKLQG